MITIRRRKRKFFVSADFGAGFRMGFQSAGAGKAPLAVKSFKTCYILLFCFLYTQFCFFRFINILEVSLEESYHLTKLD